MEAFLGNGKPVRVGKMPGKVVDFLIEEDSHPTVKEMIERAEMDYDGFQIRLNDEVCSLTDTVKEGDVILLLKKTKSNN